MLFQKSHRRPRPPSHVYALAMVMAFLSPGPSYSVTLNPKVLTAVSVPPVWLRLSCMGFASVQGGNELAGFVASGVVEAGPLAMALEMDGLLFTIKLPYIPVYTLLESVFH